MSDEAHGGTASAETPRYDLSLVERLSGIANVYWQAECKVCMTLRSITGTMILLTARCICLSMYMLNEATCSVKLIDDDKGEDNGKSVAPWPYDIEAFRPLLSTSSSPALAPRLPLPLLSPLSVLPARAHD